MNLGLDFGQVKVGTYGTVTHNMTSGRVTMETFTTVDFMFDDGIIKTLADTLNNRQSLKGVNKNSNAFAIGLTELLGKAKADECLNDIKVYGDIRKIPKELEHTITFSKLDFAWDSAAHAYRSVGQLGIYMLGNTKVDRSVNGFVEYANLYNGDMFTCYIELDKKNWIFFHYSHGEMYFATSEVKDPAKKNASLHDLVTAVHNTKPAKRTMNVGKKEAPYMYLDGGEALKRQFHERFRANRPYEDYPPEYGDDEEESNKGKKKKEEHDEYDEYDD